MTALGDLVFVGLTLLFFALTAGFVRALDKI